MDRIAPSEKDAVTDTLEKCVWDAATAFSIHSVEKPSCTQRKFDWNFVEIAGPSEVFLEFPYAPVEWSKCGDGVYRFHGSAVRRQIISPDKFVPERKLIEVP